ncbi:thiamine phosphate synthase [Edaphobacter flagellatus]|uniref:thiamine phosphate synthase n=1 Tax=Edaphobacter flagellatus TaxID=1933044 RepID=UPI0021B3C8C9|nr:thiamine phosphate synthase [Edaphobacter flagellatus]
MLRCAITDRSIFPGDESQKRSALLETVSHWAAEGIELIQLREKNLAPDDLVEFARAVRAAIPEESASRLLINSSLRAALLSKAHGVHLPAHSPLLPDDVRRRYAVERLGEPIITVSCHHLAEVQIARLNHADAILFAPVFGKMVKGLEVTPAAGLEALHAACVAAAPLPVYALGGVTRENAPQCVEAGAAGVAGIRLFLRPFGTPLPPG